jgi:ribonuclease BN (tRNA processing enzyme)
VRSGPATAIVINGAAYLVDFGPGVVRRAAQAHNSGIAAMAVTNLTRAFLTHLHSDHTAGYADLILTPWVMGRNQPLHVHGPQGLCSMTACILQAYAADIHIRSAGIEALDVAGVRVEAHEVEPGLVYADANVNVTAFQVRHGACTQAFGYRFETPERTIVISGDTSPYEGIVDRYRGCDLLIHEVYTEASFAAVSPKWQQYRREYHTSTRQLAEIANEVRPELLVITHRENPGGVGRTPPEAEYLDEIARFYSGRVVIGHDLDVY